MADAVSSPRPQRSAKLAESTIADNKGDTKPFNGSRYQPRQPPRHSGRLRLGSDERQRSSGCRLLSRQTSFVSTRKFVSSRNGGTETIFDLVNAKASML